MRFIKKASIFLFLCVSLFSDFQMQHSLFFVVEPINQIGQILGPAPVFYATKTNQGPYIRTTYSIATNGINKKMSAFLDSDMPPGTSLWANLAPPQNAR